MYIKACILHSLKDQRGSAHRRPLNLSVKFNLNDNESTAMLSFDVHTLCHLQ